ncbi:hypothetical protein NW381_001940 [Salmonella enterica]|nr:hypothetical protein [Salmonella enterica]EJS3015126.1 hypothetical protein [Salmonella enterica]
MLPAKAPLQERGLMLPAEAPLQERGLSLPRMLALLLDIKLTLKEITARPQDLVLLLLLEPQRQG